MIELINFVLQFILVTLLFLIIRRVINHFFTSSFPKRLTRKYIQMPKQKALTVNNLIKNALLYLLTFAYVYELLALLGLPVSSLIAGAGIAGVTIGLGAKDLITDVINGFFIIAEGFYEVGDLITLPDSKITGIVTQVGVRTTQIKSGDGELFFVPNSDIRIVNNLSRADRRIVIDLPLTQEMDLDTFEQCIKEQTNNIALDYKEQLVEVPTIVGVVKLEAESFNYRIVFMVTNGSDGQLKSDFYQMYLKKLKKNGIYVPRTIYD